METLILLRELGLDPASPQARKAMGLVRDKSDWGPHHGHSRMRDVRTHDRSTIMQPLKGSLVT